MPLAKANLPGKRKSSFSPGMRTYIRGTASILCLYPNRKLTGNPATFERTDWRDSAVTATIAGCTLDRS